MYTCFVETNNNMFVFRNQTFSLNSILFAHLRDFLAQPSSTTDTQGAARPRRGGRYPFYLHGLRDREAGVGFAGLFANSLG